MIQIIFQHKEIKAMKYPALGNTTEEHAAIIAESITNGQHRQAVEQFKTAMNEHCSAMALAEDIAGQGIDSSQVFTLLCRIIEGNK